MVIGPQSLLVERNFLDIVFSKAGDINTFNNILGFDGINGPEPAWAQPS